MALGKSLELGWKINHAYHLDDFYGLLVTGRQRIGKSSYVCQGLAESMGKWEYHPSPYCAEPDYSDRMRKWITFPPEEFIDLTLSLGVGTKERAALWDDAGFWLFVLDWYEPFVKVVARYIQLAGRQFGFLLLTSPAQGMISSKVLDAMPDLFIAKVVKEGEDTPKLKPRLVKVYERWEYPDGRKGGVRTRWKDHYNAILPDDFWKWYKPKSDHYLDEGLKILSAERAILRLKQAKKEKEAKGEEGELLEKVYDVTGSPERLAEVNEVIAQLATGQT